MRVFFRVWEGGDTTWFRQPLKHEYLEFGSNFQWLYPTLETCQTPSFNKIMQDHRLHVVFWPSLLHRIIDCCSGQQDFQICHPFKIYGHGFLRDWPAAFFQLIRLMKCGIDMKQHKMSDSFLPSKPSSTPCLIGYGCQGWQLFLRISHPYNPPKQLII